MRRFGDHYDIALCPARDYKPRDKALVENAVKLTYRHIYTRLEGQKFSDLHTLNLALHSVLEVYNNTRGRPQAGREHQPEPAVGEAGAETAQGR